MLSNQEITCNQYSIELDIQVTKITQALILTITSGRSSISCVFHKPEPKKRGRKKKEPEASKTKRPRGRPRKDAKPSVGLL